MRRRPMARRAFPPAGLPELARAAAAATLHTAVAVATLWAAPLPVAAQVAAPERPSRTAAWEPPPARAFEFPLTIESIMRGPEIVGEDPVGVRWSDDSEWIYFRWRPAGEPWHEERDTWRVPAAGGEPERLDEETADSLAVLFAAGDLSRDRRWRVSAVRGDLWLVDRSTMEVRRLTETAASEGDPRFAADGGRVFFRRDDGLFALSLEGGAVRQLIEVREGPEPAEEEEAEGHEAFLEAQQVELFEHIRVRKEKEREREAREQRRKEERPEPVWLDKGERVADLVPDPEGRRALIEAVSSPEEAKRTLVPEWVTESGYTEEDRAREKVGDLQEDHRVGLIETESGEVSWLDLAPRDERDEEGDARGEAGEDEGEPSDAGAESDRPELARVRLVGWNDAGTHALIFAVPFDYKSWRLYALEGATGEPTLLAEGRDEAWVDGPCFGSCIGWFPDDHPVSRGGPRAWYVSEETGYAHLYAVDADATDRERLTEGEWEVLDVTIPEGRDGFLVHTSRDSPFDRHPWRIEFSGAGRPGSGQAPVQVVEGEGFFDAVPSPDGRRLAVTVSRSNRPPELFLAENRPGLTPADLEQVTVSPAAEWLGFPWLEPEIVRFPARDGTRLPARIYRPRELGAQPNGAGVIFVHGAGYLHNVHHGWSSYYREYMFHHLLAAAGYTVLDIDYRGSAGYGRDWRTAIYRHMGGKDLSDQVDGARWLVEHEGVDPDRIGIYGGSYGGFITLMALFTAGDTFRAGAALRSVTDWAHYNHWYTSRILNLPHEDERAYRRSSPIYFAEDFGPDQHLLVLHGMEDRNVQFQDVVRLTQRLIELGKENWELAVYPVEDHSFVEPTSWTDEYRRIFELFQETLGAPSAAVGVEAGG